MLIYAIVAALMYFAFGGIAVWLGKLTVESYALFGGLAGSVASILGLVSLSRPALTQSDIENVEIDVLRKLTETSSQLKDIEQKRLAEMQKLESARVVTQEQMEQLSQQKKEMEFLVRQASLVLLLQEQRRMRVDQIEQELAKSPELREHLESLDSVTRKLTALQEEIDVSPHVELLQSVIRSSQRNDNTIVEYVNRLPPFNRFLLRPHLEFIRMFSSFHDNENRT